MPIPDPADRPGLSAAEAAERLARDGYNELPVEETRTFLTIVTEVIREPMFLLLVGRRGSSTSFSATSRRARLLLLFVFVVIGITLYQERKTERALEALRDLSSPRALVIRDGAPDADPGPRGGARGPARRQPRATGSPADALLLSGANLSADESLLTGESVPVRKHRRRPRARRAAARRRRPALALLGHARRAGPGRRRGAWPPAPAPRWARSARRCRPSSARRPRSQRETAGIVKTIALHRHRPLRVVVVVSTVSPAATGSTGFSPASRSPWPSCPRSSPWS